MRVIAFSPLRSRIGCACTRCHPSSWERGSGTNATGDPRHPCVSPRHPGFGIGKRLLMTAPFVLDFQRAGQAAARAGEAKTTFQGNSWAMRLIG